jgi:hypothetical protein
VHPVRYLPSLQLRFGHLQSREWKLQRKRGFNWVLLLVGQRQLQLCNAAHDHHRLQLHPVRYLPSLQLRFGHLRSREWKLQCKRGFNWVLLLGQRRLQLRNAAHDRYLRRAPWRSGPAYPGDLRLLW